MKLNWVTIRVRDLDRSLSFYRDLLALDIAAQFGPPDHQIVMLGQADAPKIELICQPNTTLENPGKGVSIGLEADDLDQLIARLQAHGLNPSGPVSPNPTLRFFFVQDPDGYTIQLVEQK